MENNESFEYTYSAPEQEEIRRIREKYLPPDERERKLEQLRRLDAGVTRKGTMASLMVGIIGSLMLGVGMSMCMVWSGELMAPGIAVGVAGMAVMALALPVFQGIVRRERERVAPEILRLTEELMQ